jgi:hypothetical protein
MKTRITFLLFSLLLTGQPGNAVAIPLSANIAFDAALALTNKTDIGFGFAKAAQSGVYSISPTGSVTASNNGVWIGGESHAGSVMIAGSNTQSVNISIDDYISSNGVTPSAVTCSYNGDSSAPCSLFSQVPPGAGKPLLLGITLTVDGTQTAGTTATPSFDVIVIYD